MKLKSLTLALAGVVGISPVAMAFDVPVEADPDGNRRVRVTQQQITSGELTLQEIRLIGREMFATPFNKSDGFGETPGDTPESRRTLGNRGSLQGNGTFTRINGLDAQTCAECHAVGSSAVVPFRFIVGGAGTMNDTVLGGGGASFININDDANQINPPADFPAAVTTGQSNINGRTINPPIVFGSGGVELVGNEMTQDLQALAASVIGTPNATVDLVTKDVNFGTLSTDADGAIVDADADGNADGVVGIDATIGGKAFLVVQPFGRKGNNITTRTFDTDALQFHHGMQPVEVLAGLSSVENGVDTPSDDEIAALIADAATQNPDGDNVVNEVTVGELSAMNVFSAMLERPVQEEPEGRAAVGEQLFADSGCVECHVPSFQTNSRTLGVRFPEILQDPSANVYMNLDLTKKPVKFEKSGPGIIVRPFGDFKRHKMGTDLAEFDGNDSFETARLWGVADSAPYLHDGRALTLMDAILIHGNSPGSQAADAVDNFEALTSEDQQAVISFLKTLKNPNSASKDLDRLARRIAHDDDDDSSHNGRDDDSDDDDRGRGR